MSRQILDEVGISPTDFGLLLSEVTLPYGTVSFVKVVGFEPTEPEGDGFTDQHNSPTLVYFHFFKKI